MILGSLCRKLVKLHLFWLMAMTGSAFASTVYLECSLVSTTTNTASEEVRALERDSVTLEVTNAEHSLEIRTQSPSIPIDIRMNINMKEWRSGDAIVYDENMSNNRRYSLQRVVEDRISITRTSFELDRATGHLTQETTQELGEDLSIINVVYGTCVASKKSFTKLL